MANISIPNLPSQTATTELDLLVIVNSGETTTSKITKADFLNGVGGNLVDGNGLNSLSTINAETLATGSQSIYITSKLGAQSVGGGNSGTNAIVISPKGNGGATAESAICFGNNFCDADGQYSSIFGGNGNQNSQNYGVMIGGDSNTIDSGGANSIIAGGQANRIYNNSYSAGIFGGSNTRVTGSAGVLGALNSSSVRLYAKNNVARAGILYGDTTSVSIDTGSGVLISSKSSAINRDKSLSNAADFNDTLLTNASIMASTSSFIVNNASSANSNVGIYNSNNVEINQKDNVVVIASTGYTATTDNIVVVPQLVMTQYASLDYADDTAAAAGGIVLGGLYHNAGAVRIRIT